MNVGGPPPTPNPLTLKDTQNSTNTDQQGNTSEDPPLGA